MDLTKPLLNGKLYTKSIEGWSVSWESNKNYRHWCYLNHPQNDKNVLLVLFNPGSLYASGEKLYQDHTLRILREVFLSSGINPFIINLFDFAATLQNNLYSNWENRDYKFLIFEKLVSFEFIRIIYAYGKIEHTDLHYEDVISRINLIKNIFSHLTVLKINNQTAHPRRWQFEKCKDKVHSIFCELYKNELLKDK